MDNHNNTTNDDKGEDNTLSRQTDHQDCSIHKGLSKNPVPKKDDETEDSDRKDSSQQTLPFCSSSPAHVHDSTSGAQLDVQKLEQTEVDPQNVPEVDGSASSAGQDGKGEDSIPSPQTEANQQDCSKLEGLSKNPVPKKDDVTEDSDRKDSTHVHDSTSGAQLDVQKLDQTEVDPQNVPEVDGSASSAGQDGKGEDSIPSPQTEANQQDLSKLEGLSRHLPVIIAVLMVAVLAVYFLNCGSSPELRKDRSVDIFRREFEKVKSSFPSQRAELWKRSKIHLERHLQTAQPTEPVSMILTSGRRAERTLRCLASHMAVAFSSALNGSVLHIEGLNSTMLESDQVKLDIDDKLRGAFQSDKRAAVIHRFEELPPGSTLIFYRYCDHENAAFKGASLIFTVLLGEDELKSHLQLSTVEEIVQDHIEAKFLSSAQPASFDKMDMDKFSGLWSRISHLVLPVAAEEHIEQQGCKI
ncbi:hypothetical protein AAFF_G00159680 [Aldrovandia affinis]|uniref:Torsin-1A-interacting protein 1/2 AAA+ activator domain-containing protein n=1 Tax=Aldrovandia affinis TaxID=143900 RepID=A0AAD7RQH1_9TELE|nr:hypothetical protein AAFF_G00159680 [Aldrovandia affinis]